MDDARQVLAAEIGIYGPDDKGLCAAAIKLPGVALITLAFCSEHSLKLPGVMDAFATFAQILAKAICEDTLQGTDVRVTIDADSIGDPVGRA